MDWLTVAAPKHRNHRIDDRKSSKPRMRGFLNASALIAREKGIRGFFQGFVPTTARQAANSAVRFSSYSSLKHLAQGYVAPGERLGALTTFGIGGMAGVITVYVFVGVEMTCFICIMGLL
jgi:solute carrier family 25 (mitochondrial citrate transporter), member 1